MTKRIMLACAGGFSTSMLVEKMIAAAKAKNVDVEIDATAEGRLDKLIDNVDILLLGPQVGHMEESLKKKYQDKPVVIQTIVSLDYGMMNGEKVLNEALIAYDKKHSN